MAIDSGCRDSGRERPGGSRRALHGRPARPGLAAPGGWHKSARQCPGQAWATRPRRTHRGRARRVAPVFRRRRHRAWATCPCNPRPGRPRPCRKPSAPKNSCNRAGMPRSIIFTGMSGSAGPPWTRSRALCTRSDTCGRWVRSGFASSCSAETCTMTAVWQIQMPDGSWEDEPLTSTTRYLGARGEYEHLLQPSGWTNGAFFVGLGNRLWFRDLRDSTGAWGDYSYGYEEAWWTIYPYVGVEAKRPLGNGLEPVQLGPGRRNPDNDEQVLDHGRAGLAALRRGGPVGRRLAGAAPVRRGLLRSDDPGRHPPSSTTIRKAACCSPTRRC